MKITLESSQRGKKGYALLIAFMFLGITIVTLTGMWLWTENNAALNQRNNTFNQSVGAAEAATEKVFSQMDRDFLFGNLNTSGSYYATNVPDTSLWPVQYTFSDGSGGTNQIYVGISQTNHLEPLNSQYAGLSGLAYDCTNTAVATPSGQRYNVPATVTQTFQAAIIPVFQFAIFYNLNLEMAPGQRLNVAGPVFCNQSIWEGSSNLFFFSSVQAVKTNYTTSVDPFNSAYTNSSAASVGSTAAWSGTPSANFAATIPSSPSSPNTALVMPIGNSTNSNPTNVESILNIPPAGLGAAPGAASAIAYAPSNQIYLYNESDLIVSNASYGTNGYATSPTLNATVDFVTNFTVWFQDPKSTAYLYPLQNDLILLKSTTGNFTNTSTHTGGLNITNLAATNILYKGYSFLTNVSFYDYRESATVQAVQVDIAKFNVWLTNNISTNKFTTNIMNTGQGPTLDSQLQTDDGHHFRSIYVYNSTAFSGTQLPAVRLINGSVLPSANPGLTVSTPQPLYIYGNYNVQRTIGGTSDAGANTTTNTYPAAILADAVTILSSSWDDHTYIANYGVNNREPVNTTVNAAALEGIVQTVPTATTAAAGYYSGGVENFLRLLEDWGGAGAGSQQTLTYNGSIVVMFPSIYATNYWGNNTNIYSVPTRHWAFDLNFKTAAGLPPLSPSSRALIRNNWSAY